MKNITQDQLIFCRGSAEKLTYFDDPNGFMTDIAILGGGAIMALTAFKSINLIAENIKFLILTAAITGAVYQITKIGMKINQDLRSKD